MSEEMKHTLAVFAAIVIIALIGSRVYNACKGDTKSCKEVVDDLADGLDMMEDD